MSLLVSDLPASLRQRVSRHPWAAPGLGVLIGFVLTLGWLQVAHPMLEHDDWDILLPDGPREVVSHSGRVLSDGRWLNYWWWLHGAQGSDPRAAALVFALGWAVTVTVLVRALRVGPWAVPLGAAAFAAPMATQISYWPATLAVPVALLALGTWAVWLTRRRFGLHLAVVALTVIVQVLGYPQFALTLIPLLVVIHHRATTRRLVAVAATVGISYVGGVLLVFALNAVRFDFFGLKVPDWRKPTPLPGAGPVVNHLAVGAEDWLAVARTLAVPVVLVTIGLVLCRRSLRSPRALLVIGGAAVLVLGLNSASTLTSGVTVPVRAMVWVWLAVVVALGWLIRHATPGRAFLVTAVVVAVTTAWSVLYSADLTLKHQDVHRHLARVEDRIIAALAVDPHRRVLFQSPEGINGHYGTFSSVTSIGNELAYRISLQDFVWCTTNCGTSLGTYEAAHAGLGPVFLYGDTIVVRVPRAVSESYLRVTQPARWLAPFGTRLEI